jgi:hypothetical protein
MSSFLAAVIFIALSSPLSYVAADCFIRRCDYPGNDLSQVTGVTSGTACQAACQATSGCLFFTYNGDNNMCFLKTASSALNCAYDANIMVGPKVCIDCFVRGCDYDAAASPVVQQLTAGSGFECQAACKANSACLAFTFNGDNNNCFLQSTSSALNCVYDANILCGPKNCPGCLTTSGAVQNAPCVFPFTYSTNNVVYYSCTYAGDTNAWCATAVSGGTYVSGSGQWGYCGGNCPIGTNYYGVLPEGGTMNAGDRLSSPDLSFHLDMQSDGNLILYNGIGAKLWQSGTAGTPQRHAILQTDANFVIYDSNNNAQWASHTHDDGNQGGGVYAVTLALQNDGNLVLYDSSGSSSYWAAGTVQSGHYGTTYISSCGVINSPIGAYPSTLALKVGDALFSTNGLYNLALQPTGNLVLSYGFNSQVLWSSGTAGSGATQAVLQLDGNFVLYDGNNNAKWSSATSISPLQYGSVGLFIDNSGGLTLQGRAPKVADLPLYTNLYHRIY